MDSLLRKAWKLVTDKLGAIASFLLPAAEQIQVAVSQGDKAKILLICDEIDSRTHETREACDAADAFTAHVRKSADDNRLDLIEGGEGALLLERLVDELEDIATGKDEDDEPPAGEG